MSPGGQSVQVGPGTFLNTPDCPKPHHLTKGPGKDKPFQGTSPSDAISASRLVSGSAWCTWARRGTAWTLGALFAQGASQGPSWGINGVQPFFPRISAFHEPTASLLVKQLVPEPDPIFTPGERAKGQVSPGSPEPEPQLAESGGGGARGREDLLFFSQTQRVSQAFLIPPPDHLPPL